MNAPKDSLATKENDREPVFRLTINLTESTIVAILTLLVGVGFGVQIGGSKTVLPEPQPLSVYMKVEP